MRSRPLLAVRLAVAIGSVLVSACHRDPADAWRGMNIVRISFESVRADHCSFSG